jgi:hypothetical protein
MGCVGVGGGGGKIGSVVAQERFHILETEKAALASRAATLEDALRARDAERAAMAAALHELRGNIRVIARMRPPSAREVAVGECVLHHCHPSVAMAEQTRAHTHGDGINARTREDAQVPTPALCDEEPSGAQHRPGTPPPVHP